VFVAVPEARREVARVRLQLLARHVLARLLRALVVRPLLLARLAPVDYHHVHYPDDGRTRD